MSSITLDAYTIKVHKLYSSDSLPLGHFHEDNDLLDWTSNFLARATINVDEQNRRAIRQIHTRIENRTIRSTIEHGVYGTSNVLFDVIQREESYERSPTEAELTPFYFQVRLPPDLPVGIMICQRVGQQGFKSALMDAMSATFNLSYPNHRLDISRLVPRQALRDLLQADRVKRVRFIKYRIPPDKAEEYLLRGVAEEDGHMEIVFEARRGGSLPLPETFHRRFEAFIADQRNEVDMLEIDGDIPDDVKVELIVQGKKRTVSFANPARLKPTLDITDEVELGEDGHPTFETVDACATEYMNMLAGELWGADGADED